MKTMLSPKGQPMRAPAINFMITRVLSFVLLLLAVANVRASTNEWTTLINTVSTNYFTNSVKAKLMNMTSTNVYYGPGLVFTVPHPTDEILLDVVVILSENENADLSQIDGIYGIVHPFEGFERLGFFETNKYFGKLITTNSPRCESFTDPGPDAQMVSYDRYHLDESYDHNFVLRVRFKLNEVVPAGTKLALKLALKENKHSNFAALARGSSYSVAPGEPVSFHWSRPPIVWGYDKDHLEQDWNFDVWMTHVRIRKASVQPPDPHLWITSNGGVISVSWPEGLAPGKLQSSPWSNPFVWSDVVDVTSTNRWSCPMSHEPKAFRIKQ